MRIIILATLGLYITFMRKYRSRSKKDSFSFKYWINDNWVELSQSVALLTAMLIILISNDAVVNLDTVFEKIPFPGEFHFPGKEVLSFLLGFAITEIMYWLNNRKKRWVKDNTIER